MAKYRKIIHISAEDSPNVQRAQEQREQGIEPNNEIVIPGILPNDLYETRMALWDDIRKCISLSGRFWEGKEVMMFPQQWLALGLQRAIALRTHRGKRYASAIGIDPGEGSADTCFCAGDDLGILDFEGYPTPDTSLIKRVAKAMMIKWRCDPDNCVFDRGGGGKQIADELRSEGYDVSTIAFGEQPSTEPKHGMYTVYQRLDIREEKSAYFNMRSQMYYEARCMLNPDINPEGYGLPGGDQGRELVRQLSLIPLKYDQNGKIYLPPKNRKPGQVSSSSTNPTLSEIIGRSPDQADAFVIMVHRMLHGAITMEAGTFDDQSSTQQRIEEDFRTGRRVSSEDR